MYAIVFHAHQKLDRVAYRHLRQISPGCFFPNIKEIINFDGPKGPDGARLKRQKDIDQPWHFIDPSDKNDIKLQLLIQAHYNNLIKFLKAKDEVKSAFEAAWLAHAIVDGLTPAHHYPYENELEKIYGGSREDRKGIFGRAYVKKPTIAQSLAQSLKIVGPRGLLTTHAMFEAGAYAIIAPLKLASAMPSPDDLAKIANKGITTVFREIVNEIADLDLYGQFYVTGWTRSLSRDVRQQLAPRMVRMVTLAWYSASVEAGLNNTVGKVW
jgi:hypothetical protein